MIYTDCRTCGAPVPPNSIQGSHWHRRCVACYRKGPLPTNVDEATEIGVVVDGEWFRVFPHVSSDGLLAMRVLPSMDSYVLMPNGNIRMRPETFVLPEGLPSVVKDKIELSFIITDNRVEVVKKIFEAYKADKFEVIDS